MGTQLVWDKIGKVCVYLLFGLVPVFFLPLTALPVVENKAMLAGVLALIGFGAWLAKILSTGKFSIPRTRFFLVMAAFFVIAGISTFLSKSANVSLWGNPTSPDSYFNFIIYGLALLLVPIFLNETRDLIRALLAFSISLFALSLYSLLQFFGVFVLPLDFTKNVAFNPIGTVQSLAIFLGSGLVMVIALLTSFKLSQLLKIVFAAGAVVLSLILIFVNFNYVWLGILFAAALVVSWQIMHSRDSGEGQAKLAPKFGLTLVLMVIVAILFFVRPPISAVVRLPAEVRPSFSATLQIAQDTLSVGMKQALLGSGPATFLYEYLAHRSPDLNATAFWGVRFVQGFATMPTLLVTTGVLGLASVLFMFGFFIWVGFRGVAALSRKKSSAERIALISFVSFLFLLLSWFFYPANFSIMLFTFLFAGMVISSLRIGDAIGSFEVSILASPQRTFLGSLVIIVLIVAVIVGVYWQGQKYVASLLHTAGVTAYNKDQNLDRALSKIGLAVNFDASKDSYWRTFAQLLSLRAREVLNAQDVAASELQQRYQVVLQGMIQAGQRGIDANPLDPLNWRQLGVIYEDNIAIVGGADRFAVTNYEKAASQNPQNPAEYMNVARAYVRASDSLQAQITRLSQGRDAAVNKEEIAKAKAEREDKLEKSLEALAKSISLKADYAPAHFLSSQVYERQGNRALAIEKSVEARDLNPLDTGVGYQLGLLYYLDNQVGKAQEEFGRVVRLSENFSNARYFLGLTHDKLGNKRAAIEQFEKVAELNPENSEVKRILENLRAGKEALANVVPPPQSRIETPVEERGGEVEEEL